MKLRFVKMQGCGNDYIYFDGFDQTVEHPQALSRRLSSYHTGIGGDGIIVIDPSDKADARMRIFNRDGSEGKMCGNGIRCVGKYLYDSGRVKRDCLTVDSLSGVKTLRLAIRQGEVEAVTVDMGPAILTPQTIPVKLPGSSAIHVPVEVGERDWRVTCVSMGNPHAVVFVKDVVAFPLERTGPLFEHHPLFPEGVNTEFVQVIDRRTLKMRVWERGSGETLACGTGACAAAVAGVLNGCCGQGEDITVKLRGGDLVICYTGERVWMTGPAETVFTGEVDV